MTLNAWSVIPTIVATAYGLLGLCTIFARLGGRAHQKLERRYWRTLYTRTCDLCHHEWERIPKAFDPDLGFKFDKPYTCPACRADIGMLVEIDFDTMSASDIARAFDRDFAEEQVAPISGADFQESSPEVRALSQDPHDLSRGVGPHLQKPT